LTEHAIYLDPGFGLTFPTTGFAGLPDTMAAALEREGWNIRRLAGIHHDMHLEDPGRTLEVIDDVL
jgi:hypothetical protein